MNPNTPYPDRGYPQHPVYPQQQGYPQRPGYPQQPGMYPPPGGYPPPVRQYTVSFGQAISRAFSNYATFTGRASRSEFWWWQLFVFLVILIPLILLITGMASFAASESYYDSYYDSYHTPAHSSLDIYRGLFAGVGLIGLVLYGIICLGLFIPNLAMVWRRLHDIGRSGMWYLLSLVPVVNYVWSIVMLVWCCTPSKPFDNEYGPVPNRLSY